MSARKCGHPLGDTSWCPDCELAEARSSGEFRTPVSAPKLSDAQQSFMRAVDGEDWMRPREKDGTLMPRATEVRTVRALERLGLIKWVHVGEDGYRYNGVVRAVAKVPGHG